jgi:uncharacterized membrane protein (Fun14 family)
MVIKLLALVVGMFFGPLIYLRSQSIINLNWDKFQSVSETTLSTIGDSISNSREISNTIGNIGIPLIGSLSAVFAVGFVKG